MVKIPGMICRAWITRNGERVYARDHNLKAFCFFPNRKKQKTTFSEKVVASGK